MLQPDTTTFQIIFFLTNLHSVPRILGMFANGRESKNWKVNYCPAYTFD